MVDYGMSMESTMDFVDSFASLYCKFKFSDKKKYRNNKQREDESIDESKMQLFEYVRHVKYYVSSPIMFHGLLKSKSKSKLKNTLMRQSSFWKTFEEYCMGIARLSETLFQYKLIG